MTGPAKPEGSERRGRLEGGRGGEARGGEGRGGEAGTREVEHAFVR